MFLSFPDQDTLKFQGQDHIAQQPHVDPQVQQQFQQQQQQQQQHVQQQQQQQHVQQPPQGQAQGEAPGVQVIQGQGQPIKNFEEHKDMPPV